MTTIWDHLPAHAAEITARLREAGFPQRDERERQLLALAEEAGEFVGAARRFMGWARRTGSLGDAAMELADVVITTYVTAAVFQVDLPNPADWPEKRYPQPRQVLSLHSAVTSAIGVCELYADGSGSRSEVAYSLSWVVAKCRDTAAVFRIDLDADVQFKLGEIFTRGWRDERTESAA